MAGVSTAVMRSDEAMSAEAEHAERVEQTLAQGFPWLSFVAPLETHFLRHAEAARRRAITTPRLRLLAAHPYMPSVRIFTSTAFAAAS